MPGPGEYRRQVCLVYGQTGSGKTILARALFRARVRALGARAAGLIVDTLEEHSDVPIIALDSVENYLAADVGRPSVPRLGRVLVDSELEFDALAADLENGYNSPRDGRRRGPVALMVDEVSYWTSPNRSTPGLSRLIRYGRHWQVDLIAVARRPAETSRELSAQASALYIVGGIVEPRDLAYMKQVLPDGALSISANLTGHRYLKYNTDGTYAVCPPVKII